MNDKIYNILLLSSACTFTVVSLYLAYKVKKKENHILELEREISLLKQNIKILKFHDHKYSNGSIPNEKIDILKASHLSGINHLDESLDISISDEKFVLELASNSGEDEFFDSCENFDKNETCNTILEKVENLERLGDTRYVEAYKLLSQFEFQIPKFYCAKAKFSRYLARIEEENDKNDEAKTLFFEAYKYAKIAENIDANSPEVMRWCAITLGDLSMYMGLSERVKNAIQVKVYAEICLSKDEFDPLILHLLGRWHYKVASLGWFEIRAAKSICSEFPTSTINKALEYFLQAESIMPNTYLSNLLYIAKCLLTIKPSSDEAYEWLQKGLQLSIKDADDRKSYAEINEIIRSRYS